MMNKEMALVFVDFNVHLCVFSVEQIQLHSELRPGGYSCLASEDISYSISPLLDFVALRRISHKY